MIGSLFLGNWSRRPDWPKLHHGVLCLLAVELRFQYDVLTYTAINSRFYESRHQILCTYIDGVTSFLGYVGDGAQCTRREHDFVFVDKRVLVDISENVTSGNVIANLQHQ